MSRVARWATLGVAAVATLFSMTTASAEPASRDGQLAAKTDLYLQLSAQTLDSHGWLEDTHCDGLLYSGLYAAVGGPAQIDDAEEEAVVTEGSVTKRVKIGKFHRHWEQDCYANSRLPPEERPPGRSSGSTISRDMLMGLLHWAWTERRLDVIERFVAYGEAHSLAGIPLVWVVGEGDASRVTVSPGLVVTFYEMRERLGGAASPAGASRLETWGKCAGYECHLQALHILLMQRMRGSVSDGARANMTKIADANPRNALYQAIRYRVDGDVASRERAIDTLLDTSLFPNERLPASEDRCAEYLFQRDAVKDGAPNPDWLPCNEGKKFSGVDLLLAASVVLGRI